MKHLFIFLFLSSAAFAQQKKFTLSATLKGCPDKTTIYLNHKYNDETFTDSALVNAEKAVFKGSTPEPNMYWITMKKNTNPLLIFFLEGGKAEISGHIDSLGGALVKAGKTQEEYKTSLEIVSRLKVTKAGMLRRFQKCNDRRDAAGAQAILDSAHLAERNYSKEILAFIKNNPHSNIGAYMIFSAVYDWPSIGEYDTLYAALSEKVKKGKFGKLALDKINSIKGTTIGYPALDFTQTDPTGKSVSLSSFRGKYVLVDFWASWCGPCRRENPNVVATWNKYKDKGFDVFGVSLDDNKERWLQAVQKDGLSWTHVSDLKGWQNAAAKSYGITSIPSNLLLDKDGKILAKNLRGPDLEAALAQIFGE